MSFWNGYDSELEHELRTERDEAHESLFKARRHTNELRRQLTVLRRYIEVLEKQLDTDVVEEIKDELSAQEERASHRT